MQRFRTIASNLLSLLISLLVLAILGLKVRVVSTGVPAQMTYDSLWKYRYWYDGCDFDLVIFYHGINDARANNYPREVFRDDYTQFSYYQRFRPAFDWIEQHPPVSCTDSATHLMSCGCFIGVSPLRGPLPQSGASFWCQPRGLAGVGARRCSS